MLLLIVNILKKVFFKVCEHRRSVLVRTVTHVHVPAAKAFEVIRHQIRSKPTCYVINLVLVFMWLSFLCLLCDVLVCPWGANFAFFMFKTCTFPFLMLSIFSLNTFFSSPLRRRQSAWTARCVSGWSYRCLMTSRWQARVLAGACSGCGTPCAACWSSRMSPDSSPHCVCGRTLFRYGVCACCVRLPLFLYALCACVSSRAYLYVSILVY